MVGFSGTAYLTASFKFTPRMTPVAMTMNFWTKSAITRFIWEISRIPLRIAGGFGGRAIEWCQTNSTTTNPPLPWQRHFRQNRL